MPLQANRSLSCARQERSVVLILLLIAIAVLGAVGTALYLAYVETEADFPVRYKLHRGVQA